MNLNMTTASPQRSHDGNPILTVALDLKTTRFCGCWVNTCNLPTQQNGLFVSFDLIFYLNCHKSNKNSHVTEKAAKTAAGVSLPGVSKRQNPASYFWIVAALQQCKVQRIWSRTMNHKPLNFTDIRTYRNHIWLASLSPGNHKIKPNSFLGSAINYFTVPLKLNSRRSPIRPGEQLKVHINIPPGSRRPALPVPIRPPLLPQIYLSSNIFSSRCRSGTPPAAPTLPLW